MKIAVASDLHLEFGDLFFNNSDHADVLILSGDICVAADIGSPDPHGIMEGARSNRIVDFFKRCSFQFPHVIYVLGNHEHYHGDFATTYNKIQSMLESNMLSNVYLLDNEIKQIDDVTFIGGTLWTDMNKEDPRTLSSIRGMMNDYRVIRNSSKKVSYKGYMPNPDDPDKDIVTFHERDATFCPEDSVEDHKAMLAVICDAVAENPAGKFVVVGHHSPSKLSTKPQYQDDVIVNGAYSSDLSEFILDHPKIKLWTHGHTHYDFDYVIGETRIVANPRGYIGYEAQADHFQPKLIEV